MTKVPGFEARLALIKGRFFLARRLNEAAAQEVERVDEGVPPEKEVEFELLRDRILFRLGRTREVVHRGLRFMQSRKLKSSYEGDFYVLMSAVALKDREIDQAKEFSRRARALFEKAEDLPGLKVALRNLAIVAQNLCDPAEAVRQSSELCSVASRIGDFAGYCEGLDFRGSTRIDSLEFEEALADFERASGLLGDGFSPHLKNRIRISRGQALRILGDYAAAESDFSAAEGYFRGSRDTFSLGQVIRLQAALALDGGDPSGARTKLEEAEPLLKDVPDQMERLEIQRIEIALALGENERAGEFLARLLSVGDLDRLPYFDRLHVLTLRSAWAEGRDPGVRDDLVRLVKEPVSRNLPLKRLPALVGLLESGPDETVREEVLALAETIRKAFPERYRRNFDRKREIVRLRELLRDVAP